MAVDDKSATIKIGNYRAIVSALDMAWTGHKRVSEILFRRDLAQFSIQELRETTAHIQLSSSRSPGCHDRDRQRHRRNQGHGRRLQL